ncbi:serine/threonine-protein kinase [Ureaplasma canigenitalium]|uniref:serine/threonine-protein kinase n=1 Tax=Ureaplasma canigenitalium TaxID=42092 RepID=UPI0004E25B25|nr:serine/threonine-protein kinase [Ureaplasma canigenitalium]
MERKRYNKGDILNNKYQILKYLASGGFSDVYLVCLKEDYGVLAKTYDDEKDQLKVKKKKVSELEGEEREKIVFACKVLYIKDKEKQETFFDEVKILKVVKNLKSEYTKNIAQFIEYFELGSLEHENYQICIIQEYVDGITLANYLALHPNLTWISAVRVIKEIALGLKAFHESNFKIIHRDLKPENCLVNLSLTKVKIIDYGASSAFYSNKDLTLDRDIKCSIPYAPPSILKISNEITKKAKIENKTAISYNAQKIYQEVFNHHYDIHSLGVMLYELIANKLPFDHIPIDKGKSETKKFIEMLKMYERYDYDPLSLMNPTIPIGIDNILTRCFAWKPKDYLWKYPDINAFIKDLDAVFDEQHDINQNYYKPLETQILYKDRKASLNSIKKEDQKFYLRKWMLILITSIVCILVFVLIVLLIYYNVGNYGS